MLMAVVWITWRNKVWRPEKTWWHSHGGIKSLTPFKDLVCVLRISPLLELFLSVSTIAHRCLHKLEEPNSSDWLLCVYVPGWPPTVTFKQSGGPDDTHIMNPSASFIHPTHSVFTALHPCLCTHTHSCRPSWSLGGKYWMSVYASVYIGLLTRWSVNGKHGLINRYTRHKPINQHGNDPTSTLTSDMAPIFMLTHAHTPKN